VSVAVKHKFLKPKTMTLIYSCDAIRVKWEMRSWNRREWMSCECDWLVGL
jgi:hypothetical protein